VTWRTIRGHSVRPSVNILASSGPNATPVDTARWVQSCACAPAAIVIISRASHLSVVRPRNVSTALMYSFAERADTKVADEPLYGHFPGVTGTIHPGRDEVLEKVDCDGNAVIQKVLIEASDRSDILFMKQMAYHLVEIDWSFLEQIKNVFLIRDPREMLPSLTIQMPHATLADTGLEMQWHLFESLRAVGQNPVVIDSRELLLDPAGVLKQLCE